MGISYISFLDWKLEADVEKTKITYLEITKSGADECLCNECLNYRTYRENVFPEEIRDLFEKLGIDYRKESEVVNYQKLGNGFYLIGGWFHFKGKILKGPAGNKYKRNDGMEFINELFSIGFYENDALTFFKDKNSLIQVEFMTQIPWVIDKELETDI